MLYIASGYFTERGKGLDGGLREERSSALSHPDMGMPQLRRLLTDHMDIAFRHNVHTESLRRVADILAVEAELTDRLWYGRNRPTTTRDGMSIPRTSLSGRRRECAESRRRSESTSCGVTSRVIGLGGFLSGKVSAIRWVLGYD